MPPRFKKTTPSQIERAPSYWNSISADEKVGFLEITVADLKKHYLSSTSNLESNFLQEVISFAEANSTWNYWACVHCDRKFQDCHSHMKHVVDEHLHSFIPKLRLILSQKLSAEFVSRDLEPIDVPSAIKILQDIERDGSGIDCVTQQWPPSDDRERAKLLEGIQGMLKMLVDYRCLSHGLLKYLLLYSKEKFRHLASGSALLKYQPDDLHFYFRILGAPQLREILHLLRVVSHSCGVGKIDSHCRKDGSLASAAAAATVNHVGQEGENLDVLERFVLQSNPPKLVLVSNSFWEKFGCYPNGHKFLLPDGDAFVSWLFSSPPIEKWVSLCEIRLSQGKEILERLKKKSQDLFEMFKAKRKLLKYGKDLATNSENNSRPSDPFHLAVQRERLEEIEETAEIMKMLTNSEDHAYSNICSETSASLVVELNMLEARIAWTHSSIRQLGLELGAASAYDYHAVLMSLVKPFLQMRMKDLVDADACKNSVAQSSGANHGKQAKKKSNQKKKSKGHGR